MTAAETLTILRSRTRRLAKTIHPDGSISPWDEAKHFDIFEHPIADLEALALLLKRLEQRWDCAVVRGKPADPERTRGVRRLLAPDSETGDLPTLHEAPRRWVALDVDGVPRPDSIDPADLPGCAVVVISCLPSEFRPGAFVVQATAGHGTKRGIRLRLWCWLSRPVAGPELKFWLRSAPVDPRVFIANQVVYTAAPVFVRGARDPLPSRSAAVSGCAAVLVPPPARLKPRNRTLAPDRQGPGNNISALLRLVETAAIGNRSNLLYWAARRVTEKAGIDRAAAAHELEQAAVAAGLSPKEAAGTVRSALRHGGRHGL
jgi:hypothetical protein